VVTQVTAEPGGSPLAELARPDVLQRLLVAALAGTRAAAAVAVVGGDAGAAAAAASDPPAARAQPVGCLAKLVTAALARISAAARRLAFDDDVAELLGARGHALRGVTVRHLLEHTHGLDDSLLEEPRYERGFICRRDLLERVAQLPRLAAPGAIYSYGNLGAWLVASVLERVHARTYAVLVRRHVLPSLDARGAEVVPCAATGRGLGLTVLELARFATQAIDWYGTSWPSAADTVRAITRLPGWNPLECGVHLGWKYAGHGWFGHQSAWPRASAYLRIHPARRLALVVQSRDVAAAVVAARLFGQRLPELFALPAPRATADAAAWQAAQFERAAQLVSIEPCGASLRLTARSRARPGRWGETASWLLADGIGGIRFARPGNELFPYVQLVAAPGGAAWLWNGRFVMPRVR
jgi:CubicO group peptidase (beta-lactamase class C family)